MLSNLLRKNSTALGDDYGKLEHIFIKSHDLSSETEYNVSIVNEVQGYLMEGMELSSLAQIIGVAPKSLLDFMETQPYIKQKWVEASLLGELEYIRDLRAQSNEGNFSATKFFLMNRGRGWFDKPVQEIEPDDSPKLIINGLGNK